MKGFYSFIILFITAFLFSPPPVSGQSSARVYLHDKPHASEYLSDPLRMLSPRALERRRRMGISLDERDVPVYRPYLEEIARVSGIRILGHSKWMNAVHVEGDSTRMASLASLPYVDSVVFDSRLTVRRPSPAPEPVVLDSALYGPEPVPYRMHQGFPLHARGLTGRGVLVALLDAGYTSADTSRQFAPIFARGGVVDTYNFPDDTTDVFTRHLHGTAVWSMAGGYLPGKWVGPAYEADYCLYISEDVTLEMPVEETWWVMAAERADSTGADVINSSLGYTEFDNSAYNHIPQDLDGRTAFASRGAQIATEKGIHVVVAAGNLGATSWQKISVPADAEDVIAVGAVNAEGERAPFSSTGPTADGRIKPDVMSWGVGVRVYLFGRPFRLNGTSLAAPVIAGFTADMVQAYPRMTPRRMKGYLLRASDRYYRPDTLYGYGIPSFARMRVLIEKDKENQLARFRLYPNPSNGTLRIDGLITPISYTLWDLSGKLVSQGKLDHEILLPWLRAGIYILRAEDGEQMRYFKLIKL
ncbi:MAG: S8 family serine peptidase [Chlorobi bacterium]|nr:S8 family serine peptidase [Chlorobiota bacterium]